MREREKGWKQVMPPLNPLAPSVWLILPLPSLSVTKMTVAMREREKKLYENMTTFLHSINNS